MIRSFFTIVPFLIILIGCSNEDEPRILNVPGDYSSVGNALSASKAGDVVLVWAGHYSVQNVVIPDGVTLEGNTADPREVILDGGGTGRVLRISEAGPDTRILNVTITGGVISEMNQSGGGVHLSSATPVFNNCRFENNHARHPSSFGGAISTYMSSARFVDCIFKNNTSSNTGGAVFLSYSSHAMFVDCSFVGNEASHGGALATQSDARPTFRRCHFENNTGYEGAALKISFSRMAWIDSCVFVHNVVDRSGSGIYAGAGDTLFVRNSLFMENTISRDARKSVPGGPTLSSGFKFLFLENCTIANNEGSSQISTNGGWIVNTIIYGQQARTAWAHQTASAPYPRFFRSCLYGHDFEDWSEPIAEQLPHDHNMNFDPLFVNTEASDYRLLPGSPCLPGNNLFGGLVGALGEN